MGQLSQQVKDSLNGLIQVINESEGELQVLISTSMIGIMSKRMFNYNEGSKNAAGESLGVYSSAYKAAKTADHGAMLAAKVNLYATGTLYGSVKQVKSGDNTYVAVTDVKYPSTPPTTKTRKDGTTYQTKGSANGQSTVEVANYLNKQYGEIFAPTKEEVKEIEIIGDKFVKRKTDEYFNQ